MGNSSTKESRGSSNSQPQDFHDPRPLAPLSTSRHQSGVPSDRFNLSQSNRSRNGRHDVSFLGIGNEQNPSAPRRETKQEREARKLEKERVARTKERERSLREEGVDGGYLVTLGTYVGTEDFSKPIVRQLMIERRLAPFWRGLNDHSESWTEHQLVAAAQGKPIPAPDEIPVDDEDEADSGKPSEDHNSQPISFGDQSYDDDSRQKIASLSKSHPTGGNTDNTSPLFRGRSKTLASLTSTKKDLSPEYIPQEVQLPSNPFLNGQRVEASLYKDVLECPICFLYYPPFLNKTRCCDQPICSECFVQIKRPDPHPPEHTDPNSPPPAESQRLAEETQLVSEPASCPFCVQPELGITYEPPPFRRGLIYQGQTAPLDAHTNDGASGHSIDKVKLEMNTSSTSNSLGGRRRGQSLSTTDPAVISTDKVRPDWFKKLSDARAHVARRSAAATALHSAAYVIGSHERTGFGRRRRHILRDNSGNLGEETHRFGDAINIPNIEALLAALEGQGSSRDQARSNGEVLTSRGNTRTNRVEDLEEVMMMEAIRQSLAAEEERKKRSEKEAKKEEKKAMKEQKKADRTAKKELHSSNAGASNSEQFAASEDLPAISLSEDGNKGKARLLPTANNAQFNSTKELTPPGGHISTLSSGIDAKEDAQRHLPKSKVNLEFENPENSARGSERQYNNLSPSMSKKDLGIDFSTASSSRLSPFNPSKTITGTHDSATSSEGHQTDLNERDTSNGLAHTSALQQGTFSRVKGDSGESSGSGSPEHEECSVSNHEMLTHTHDSTVNEYERSMSNDNAGPSTHAQKHGTNVNFLERSFEL